MIFYALKFAVLEISFANNSRTSTPRTQKIYFRISSININNSTLLKKENETNAHAHLVRLHS